MPSLEFSIFPAETGNVLEFSSDCTEFWNKPIPTTSIPMWNHKTWRGQLDFCGLWRVKAIFQIQNLSKCAPTLESVYSFTQQMVCMRTVITWCSAASTLISGLISQISHFHKTYPCNMILKEWAPSLLGPAALLGTAPERINQGCSGNNGYFSIFTKAKISFLNQCTLSLIVMAKNQCRLRSEFSGSRLFSSLVLSTSHSKLKIGESIVSGLRWVTSWKKGVPLKDLKFRFSGCRQKTNPSE